MSYNVVRFWVLVIFFFVTTGQLQAGLQRSVTRDLTNLCAVFEDFNKARKSIPYLVDENPSKIQCLQRYNAHIEYCTGNRFWILFSVASGKYKKCIDEFDRLHPWCTEQGISSNELSEEIQSALWDSLGGASWFSQAVLSTLYQAGEDFIRCGVAAGVGLANSSGGRGRPFDDTPVVQWANENAQLQACFNTALNAVLYATGLKFPELLIGALPAMLGSSMAQCHYDCRRSGRSAIDCGRICSAQTAGDFVGQVILFGYLLNFNRGKVNSTVGQTLAGGNPRVTEPFKAVCSTNNQPVPLPMVNERVPLPIVAAPESGRVSSPIVPTEIAPPKPGSPTSVPIPDFLKPELPIPKQFLALGKLMESVPEGGNVGVWGYGYAVTEIVIAAITSKIRGAKILAFEQEVFHLTLELEINSEGWKGIAGKFFEWANRLGPKERGQMLEYLKSLGLETPEKLAKYLDSSVRLINTDDLPGGGFKDPIDFVFAQNPHPNFDTFSSFLRWKWALVNTERGPAENGLPTPNPVLRGRLPGFPQEKLLYDLPGSELYLIENPKK